MKISINENELKTVVENYFKSQYNLSGKVEISNEGASIEVSMGDFKSPVEEEPAQTHEFGSTEVLDNTITSKVLFAN